ncbi:MAG: 30S ribosomal protein S8 [Chromatiales bacterium]|nr:30S ribosomal protein S8 [Chromatiales bacterium]
MSMQDPISDMLTRIRNAQRAGKKSVSMAASSTKLAVAKVLETEGYVLGVSADNEAKRTMTVDLKYYQGEPVIEYLERVSRPGLRIYKRSDDLPTVRGGLGMAIVSTSKGVMSDRAARAAGEGGEVLCYVA